MKNSNSAFSLLLLLLLIISTLTRAKKSNVLYTLTKNSKVLTNKLKVDITPPAKLHKQHNQFVYGTTTTVALSVSLSVPIPKGATTTVWFSSLSSGNVARVAANQFMPNQDVCAQLSTLEDSLRRQYSLPKKCPIQAKKKFIFSHVLDHTFWKQVNEYKSYVVGSKGTLELRLWDKAPCTMCWEKAKLLVGVSLPFEILPPATKKKKKKNGKKKKKKKIKNGEL